MISARRLDLEKPTKTAQPDARGRFTFEGLTAGDYEIQLNVFFISPSLPGAPPAPGRIPSRPPVKQTVSLTEGAPTDITLVLDLGAKDKDSDR